MRRLGIFAFYEKDGIVDEFIEYFLKDFVKNLDELFIVCNGYLNPEGEKIFKSFSSNILLRKNEDYDVGAFREVLLYHLDRRYLSKYDELVLCNSTFFGPLYPLSKVFKEMENSESDFWGLTRHGQTNTLAAHLQSYFLVIRKSLLTKNDFYQFWESRKTHLKTVEEAINNFESNFTTYFSKRGYRWTTYSVAKEFETEGKDNFNHYINIPYTLAAEQKMPVVKIKTLLNKDIIGMSNEEIPLLFQYIKEKTTYDPDLILHYLIRTTDISVLKNILSLNYVISTQEDVSCSDTKAAIFIYGYSEYFAKKCLEKLSHTSIPVYLGINKNVSIDSFRGYIDKNCNVYYIDNSLGAFGALKYFYQNYLQDYEYFCFISEDNLSINKYEKKIDDTNKIENILGNTNYIKNVCNLFKQNHCLGFLFAPILPYIGKYGINYQNWMKNRKFVEYINTLYNLNAEIDTGVNSFSDINALWGRTSLIGQVFSTESNMTELATPNELNSVLGKMLIYWGKRAGYYSATLYSKTYLPNHIENISSIVLRTQQNALENNIKRHFDMVDFAKAHQSLYLYGAGKVAHSIKNTLGKEGVTISGMIVSDNQYIRDKERNPNEVIIPFSQAVEIKGVISVIVALNYKNSLEIAPYLKANGFRDVFYLYDINVF